MAAISTANPKMGDFVEPPREFIQKNANGARCSTGCSYVLNGTDNCDFGSD